MRTRLPNNLNPNRFSDSIAVYSDDYRDRYSLDFGLWGFLIPNKLPFSIYVAEGVNGEEWDDRRGVVNLLRIAQRIHSDEGKWPILIDEWEEMCPGGLVMVDVSSLARIFKSAPSLPEILQMVSGQLDKILSVNGAPFAEAEKHYREELSGLTSFNATCRMMQHEFDESPVRAISANTKARRLRYLEVLGRNAEAGIDSRRLQSSLVRWASDHAELLSTHVDPKGAILESTGIRSAGPYLDLAKGIKMVANVGKGFTLRNEARALLLVSSPGKSFSLRVEEQLFFLYELLIYDRDILIPMLKCLSTGEYKKAEIRQFFPSIYLEHLNTLVPYCSTARAKRHVEEAMARVKAWTRPQVYAEHLVDPRVSWLIDLRLCSVKKDKVSLSEGGAFLSTELIKQWEGDIAPLTEEHLRTFYFREIAPCLAESPQGFKFGEKLALDTIVQSLNEACEFVYRRTKSLAPNRIVASTLFRYLGIVLFIRHKVAADFRSLINFMTNGKTPSTVTWQLRWLPRENDGYLTRITRSGTV